MLLLLKCRFIRAIYYIIKIEMHGNILHSMHLQFTALWLKIMWNQFAGLIKIHRRTSMFSAKFDLIKIIIAFVSIISIPSSGVCQHDEMFFTYFSPLRIPMWCSFNPIMLKISTATGQPCHITPNSKAIAIYWNCVIIRFIRTSSWTHIEFCCVFALRLNWIEFI